MDVDDLVGWIKAIILIAVVVFVGIIAMLVGLLQYDLSVITDPHWFYFAAFVFPVCHY